MTFYYLFINKYIKLDTYLPSQQQQQQQQRWLETEYEYEYE